MILHLFEQYNIESFKKLSGIFSISIWDINEKKLYLIRDTVGVKPLYYYFQNQKKFFFSSSIKSILLSLDKKNINLAAFNSYTNFGRNDSLKQFLKIFINCYLVNC